MLNKIKNEDMEKFAVTSKIGLLSTVSDQGYPHITLISSLQARNENQIMWGQFTHGLSKIYLQQNEKSGFLIVNLEKKWWRGRAEHKEIKDAGQEYDMYNNQPLFRYNSYFGIGKVHFMDLVDYSGEQKLPMKAIIKGVLAGRMAKPFIKPCQEKDEKINGLSVKLAKDMSSLKFLSYIDEQGYPVLLPVVQSFMKDQGRMIIPLTTSRQEIKNIKENSKVAMFLANLDLASVLLQGVFRGVKKTVGVEHAIFDIEKVYNSMVPVVGYIYPKQPYELIH